VAKAYQLMQREIFRHLLNDGRMAPQVHSTGIPSLELFEFVSERRDENGQTWRALMSEWNATHPPKYRYPRRKGELNVARDYKLIAERLLRLTWPKRGGLSPRAEK